LQRATERSNGHWPSIME